MEKDMLILVSDFSTYPSGRDNRDGDFNGSRFRKEVLAPAIKDALARGCRVVVSLANVMSFGSSFLEEAFGGLVRDEKTSKQDIKRVLDVLSGPSENDRYRDAILRWLQGDDSVDLQAAAAEAGTSNNWSTQAERFLRGMRGMRQCKAVANG
jgi:hypothetical protein